MSTTSLTKQLVMRVEPADMKRLLRFALAELVFSHRTFPHGFVIDDIYRKGDAFTLKVTALDPVKEAKITDPPDTPGKKP